MSATLLPRRPRPCCLYALAGRSADAASVDCTICGARLVPSTAGAGWMIDVPVEHEARVERRVNVAKYEARGTPQEYRSAGSGRHPVGFVPPTPERFRESAARGRARQEITTPRTERDR